MTEADHEKLYRVELMASGSPTWDLSRNDITALKYVLAALAASQERERVMREARDGEGARRLEWRQVENPCAGCGGAGVRAYGSTATWRGGVGGQMVTGDVCDKCWGSGEAGRPWVNLRRLRALLTPEQSRALAAVPPTGGKGEQ